MWCLYGGWGSASRSAFSRPTGGLPSGIRRVLRPGNGILSGCTVIGDSHGRNVFIKRLALGIQLRKMYWLMCRRSQLSLENKLLLYTYILKPIWTYGVQLWGITANSNIEILQRFQTKILCIIVDSLWYVINKRLHHDLNIPIVKEETTNIIIIKTEYKIIQISWHYS